MAKPQQHLDLVHLRREDGELVTATKTQAAQLLKAGGFEIEVQPEADPGPARAPFKDAPKTGPHLLVSPAGDVVHCAQSQRKQMLALGYKPAGEAKAPEAPAERKRAKAEDPVVTPKAKKTKRPARVEDDLPNLDGA